MATSPNISIRAAGGLDTELAARGDSLSEILNRDIRRYYAALANALRETQLTPNEWMFLRDILNATYRDEVLASGLWAEIADADDPVAQKWGIDPLVLAARVDALPEFTRIAIVDAVDRWWRAQR